jgi:hypothetical protein
MMINYEEVIEIFTEIYNECKKYDIDLTRPQMVTCVVVNYDKILKQRTGGEREISYLELDYHLRQILV